MAEKKCPFAGKAPESLPVVLVDKTEIHEICGLLEGLSWTVESNNVADACENIRQRMFGWLEGK